MRLVSNGKGRLYSELQARNTRIRGYMLGLSKTSIFRRVLQHEVRISQQFNITVMKVTMQQKLLQHCIIISCIDNNYICLRDPLLDFPARKRNRNQQFNSSSL